MKQITIIKDNAGFALYKAFFYKCKDTDAEIKITDKETSFYCRRKRRVNDEGFYITSGILKLFTIKNNQMMPPSSSDFYIKGMRKLNTKGKPKFIK